MLLLLACAHHPFQQASDARDLATLNNAVLEYWKAVRWGDASDLLAWYTGPEDQIHVTTAYAEARVRMQDAQILHVVMGDALPKEREPATREGIAAVRVEAFDAHTGRLILETVEQHWVKVSGSWIVDTEKSPLGEGRLW